MAPAFLPAERAASRVSTRLAGWLVVVPQRYASVKESELSERGVNVVIYANHLLRSAYPAMLRTARSILLHERTLEALDDCMPIDEILQLIPSER